MDYSESESDSYLSDIVESESESTLEELRRETEEIKRMDKDNWEQNIEIEQEIENAEEEGNNSVNIENPPKEERTTTGGASKRRKSSKLKPDDDDINQFLEAKIRFK